MFLKENGKLRLIEANSLESYKVLEPAIYNLEAEVHQSFFGKRTELFFKKNDLYKKGLMIDKGIFGEIRQYIDEFFSEDMKKSRDILQMNNRLGLIFKGIPGTGKTFLAGQLAEKLVNERQAVGLLTTDYSDIDLGDLIDIVRKDDSDRFIVLIMDEFEKRGNKGNSEFLAFMDGAKSKDNMLIIATLNEIKDIPNTLTQRPGRFEKIYDFRTDKEEVLEATVLSILPKEYHDKVDIESIVLNLMDSNKVTIDYIRIEIRNLIYKLLKGEKYEIKDSSEVTNHMGFKINCKSVQKELAEKEVEHANEVEECDENDFDFCDDDDECQCDECKEERKVYTHIEKF